MKVAAGHGYAVITARIPELDNSGRPGGRLGWHPSFDTRSLAYPFRAPPGQIIRDVLHPRHIPILDQGDLGSCEGNAETGCAGTSPLFEALPAGQALDEAEAVRLYSAATTLDAFPGAYPPDDTGTDSTSVSKAAKNAGLIAGYTHATGLDGVLAGLQAGPVNVAFSWYDSFDEPDPSGLVTIGRYATVRGGHALCARGVDTVDQQVFLDNSWGTGWGDSGTFRVGYATLDRLMSEGGECVVPVPLSAPPPVPAGPDRALWAVFGPLCRSATWGTIRPDLVPLKAAGLDWAAAKGFS